jgi:DNA-binding GntR family transcriptional regulator
LAEAADPAVVWANAEIMPVMSRDDARGPVGRVRPSYHRAVDSKSASVLGALRTEIISGVLPGGTRLKEDVIAARFDVSRVPVREALRQLESEGFVVAEKFKGVTVAERSSEIVIELMQVRRGLEVLASQLAAQRAGGEQADDLQAVVRLGRSQGRAGNIDQLPPLIRQFHRLVARASGNSLLETMIDRFLDQTAWGFEQEIADRVESSWNDHGAIAAAILAGSPIQAGLLMDEHILKDEAIYRRSSTG